MAFHQRIKTYVINLDHRIDRKINILEQFKEKTEFDVILVPAHQHEIGAIGLWNTIISIFKNQLNQKDELILICEDDHQFTDHYSSEFLFECINEAIKNEADILSGGISSLNSALKVSESIYWVETFTGLQFTIFFRKSFKLIIDAYFKITDAADYKICSLTKDKYFIYPFISVQKDFGYSDVTIKNNIYRRVEDLFNKSLETVRIINYLKAFYRVDLDEQSAYGPINDLVLPAYIINTSGKEERLEQVLSQFAGRPEFDVIVVEPCKYKTERIDLWQSIRKIIELALDNDDDIILICEDSHEFAPHYSKHFLFENIIGAHRQGVDILSGGISGFGAAMPVSENRFWVGSFSSIQFILLYKNIFRQILNEPFDDDIIADVRLSEITSNKMVIYPFISNLKDFEYPDVPTAYKEINRLDGNPFKICASRLYSIQRTANSISAQ